MYLLEPFVFLGKHSIKHGWKISGKDSFFEKKMGDIHRFISGEDEMKRRFIFRCDVSFLEIGFGWKVGYFILFSLI